MREVVRKKRKCVTKLIYSAQKYISNLKFYTHFFIFRIIVCAYFPNDQSNRHAAKNNLIHWVLVSLANDQLISPFIVVSSKKYRTYFYLTQNLGIICLCVGGWVLIQWEDLKRCSACSDPGNSLLTQVRFYMPSLYGWTIKKSGNVPILEAESWKVKQNHNFLVPIKLYKEIFFTHQVRKSFAAYHIFISELLPSTPPTSWSRYIGVHVTGRILCYVQFIRSPKIF